MTSSEVTIGSFSYRWEEIAFLDALSDGWAHHGVGVLDDGTVLFARPDRASLALFDDKGRFRSELETDLTELHKITVVQDGNNEAIWVADNGHKYMPGQPRYSDFVRQGRVVLIDLDNGLTRAEILTPEHEAYERES